MSNIISRLSALRGKAITHSVQTEDGIQEFRFYPPRVKLLVSGKLKEIVEPIALAVSAVFGSSGKGDQSEQREVTNQSVTTFKQGTAPETIKLREERKDAAISRALELLLSDKTRYQIGDLLADSLRDDFSSTEADRAMEIRQFMDEIDLPLLVELVKGYTKALMPVMNAQGKSMLSGLQGAIAQAVAARAGEHSSASDQSPGE